MPYSNGGIKTTLKQYWDTGDDGSYSVNLNLYVAQCFTPDITHHFYAVSLKLFSFGSTKPVNVDIWEATAWGWPIPPRLASRSLAGEIMPLFNPKWVPFYFQEFPLLEAGKKYVITLSSPTAGIFMATNARADRTPPGYPGGWLLKSEDWGASWTKMDFEDLLFREWGYEPPPAPPPEPSISNWAPLDMEYTSVSDGFTIVVTTDRPCHLYMRWSTKKPLKHDTQELRRGINLMTGLRYCFVAWHENEQEEPGDTLIHTFIKRDWPVCQTRWFYFIGSVQDTEQPSASPIFYIHRTAIPIPITYGPVAATLSNRTINVSNVAWAPCHDAPAGTIGPWHAPPWQQLIAGAMFIMLYDIYRSYLFFDTSGIPPGSQIVAATLTLFVDTAIRTSSVAYPDICITKGVQQDPILTTDYGAQLPHTTIGGQIDIASIITGQYNDITFNQQGLAWINPGGVTRLCIRQELDVANFVPALGQNHILYSSGQKGPGYAPLLTVQYVPP